MKLFHACAYVIIDEDRLLAADRGDAPSEHVVEGKPWVTVRDRWLPAARARGERVPFVVWDAKRTHRWLGWGLLVGANITGHGKHRQTIFQFQGLRPLGNQTREDLTLLEQKRELSSDFIRSYARLKTPDFLHEFADQKGPLLSDWLCTTKAIEHSFNWAYEEDDHGRREAEIVLERALNIVDQVAHGGWGVILTPGRLRVVVGEEILVQLGYGDFVPGEGLNDNLTFYFTRDDDESDEGDEERSLSELFDRYEGGFRVALERTRPVDGRHRSHAEVVQAYLRSKHEDLAPFAPAEGRRSHADVLLEYLKSRSRLPSAIEAQETKTPKEGDS